MVWPQTTCDFMSGISYGNRFSPVFEANRIGKNCFIDRGGQLPSSNPTPLLYMFKKIATFCRLHDGYGAMLRAA